MNLPPELLELQRRWLEMQGERTLQDEFYATQFAEPFARWFAGQRLRDADASLGKPRALISVLGLSWQPVALMAAWCKPERMLVLGTSESLDNRVPPRHGEVVLSIIARIAGISRDVIESVRIGDPGEEDIYRAVRDFLSHSGIPPRQVFVDPTGGKKSMSASAALAAFLVGAPLVYVDYGEYHGPNRIPVAGTEYPRLLVNPLAVLGDLELQNVFAAFGRSDFQEAERIAKRLAGHLYEPREAECLTVLAQAYAAWDRFDFKTASRELDAARSKIEAFSSRGRWVWAESVRAQLDENLRALDALKQLDERPSCLEDGIPLLAWYLAAARRLTDAGKLSLALLLIYAAVERYVDLCLWVDFGLDDERPDYGQVADRLAQDEYAKRYDEAGRKLFGNTYEPRGLQGPLMFGNGAQLLATLAPERLSMKDLGPLRGLSAARNKCEFEHGFLPKTPTSEEVTKYLSAATALISQGSGSAEQMERAVRVCTFPRLSSERSDHERGLPGGTLGAVEKRR